MDKIVNVSKFHARTSLNEWKSNEKKREITVVYSKVRYPFPAIYLFRKWNNLNWTFFELREKFHTHAHTYRQNHTRLQHIKRYSL